MKSRIKGDWLFWVQHPASAAVGMGSLLSESHIPSDIDESILMDGVDIQGNLFSSESLSLTPIAKAPSWWWCFCQLHLQWGQLGYPKKQQGVPGTLPPLCLACPQACTQTTAFPLQRLSALYPLFSALSGITWLLCSSGISGPKTSSIKKPLEHLK